MTGRTFQRASFWLGGMLAALLLTFSASAWAQGKSELNGVWRGTFSCNGKRAELTLVFDDKGNRFQFTYPGEATGEFTFATTYDAKTRKITATPGRWVYNPAKYIPVSFTTTMTQNGKMMIGRAQPCGSVHADRVAGALASSVAVPTAESAKAQIAKAKAEEPGDFPGIWDGAIYKKDGGAVPISLSITPSAANADRRLYDVTIQAEGRVAKAGITGNRDGNSQLGVSSEKGASPSVYGNTKPRVQMAHGREFLELSLNVGGSYGAAYVWRRPAGQKPLQEKCDGLVKPWLEGRRKAYYAAQDLKVTFHPALAAYDPQRASLVEAAAMAGPLERAVGQKGVAQLLFDCAMTVPYLDVHVRDRLLEGLIDVTQVQRYRASFANYIGPDGRPAPVIAMQTELWRVWQEAAAAEARLPTLMMAASGAKTQAQVLEFVRNSVKSIQPVRPVVATQALAPVSRMLDAAGAQTAAALQEQRRQIVQKRMAGVTIPASIPQARIPFFRSLALGEVPKFARGDISFIGGMLAQSIEVCDAPPMATRLALWDVLKQSMQLVGGANYSGELSDSLRSMAQGNADFAEGSLFVKGLGCQHSFPPAIYDVLAQTIQFRGKDADGRAGLFVRSCTLERTVEQCECIRRTIATVNPEIATERYSSGAIKSAINMNPTLGFELWTSCQVGNY